MGRGRPRNDISLYIKKLQAFFDEHKRTPKKREFSNYTAISEMFGSWNNALQAAGLPLRREISPTKEKLIQSLKDYYNNHKSSPRASDCRKENGLYDTKTYLQILNLDTWAKVLQSVNLPIYFEVFTPNGRNEIEILIEVSLFIRRHHIDSVEKYNKIRKQLRANLPSSQWLADKYGSWNKALKQAGLAVNLNRYDKKMFTKELKNLASKGDVPSLNEFAKHLGVPARLITMRFGAFNKFVTSLGFTAKFNTPNVVTEDKEQLKQLYINFSNKYGYANGAPTRTLDKSKEIYSSDVFIVRFGSINELRQACGYKEVIRVKKKFCMEEIKTSLLNEYNKLHRVPTNDEINSNNKLPSLTTILRCFKTTSMDEVWKTILKH
jgi:hypothetical protein